MKAKIDQLHRLHDTGARYITEIAKCDRGLAKEAARHADPETTERYIAVASSELALAVHSVPRPQRNRPSGRLYGRGQKRKGIRKGVWSPEGTIPAHSSQNECNETGPSLAGLTLRELGAGGSNPLTPTNKIGVLRPLGLRHITAVM